MPWAGCSARGEDARRTGRTGLQQANRKGAWNVTFDTYCQIVRRQRLRKVFHQAHSLRAVLRLKRKDEKRRRRQTVRRMLRDEN